MDDLKYIEPVQAAAAAGAMAMAEALARGYLTEEQFLETMNRANELYNALNTGHVVGADGNGLYVIEPLVTDDDGVASGKDA